MGDDLMQNYGTYFLFPFGRIKPGVNVFIYGAGRAGQMYIQQILASNYCELLGVLDQRADEYRRLPCQVWKPDVLLEKLDYDAVIISVQKAEIQREIAETLKEKWSVPKEKIIFPSIDEKLSTATIEPSKYGELIGVPAFERSEVPIAFIFGTGRGLGDAVISLKLVESLLMLAPKAMLDIFVEDEVQNEYVNVFYKGVQGFCSVQPVTAYDFHREKYVLVIHPDRFVNIMYMDEEKLSMSSPALLKAMLEIKKQNKQYFREDTSVNARNYTLSHILGTDCYTCLGGGALPIKDNNVVLPSWPEYEDAFKQLGLRNYITFNCDSGGKSGHKQVKEWPTDYMEKYLEIVKSNIPDLEIIQLGGKGMLPLAQADRHYLGLDLRLVEQILAHSLLHVDIEGGLVHLASQLGAKCAVIFGPTDPAHFGYKSNINLMSDVCVPCFGVRVDAYHCLRGQHDRPPCMCAVKPEEVWERTREWLEKSMHQKDCSCYAAGRD